MTREPADRRRPSIAVLFGGASHEHDISVMSAKEVLRVLPADRYRVTPVLIGRSGDWKIPGHLGSDASFRRVVPIVGGLTFADANADQDRRIDLDVVFPLLHGSRGEDGAIQGLLDMMRLPYVGSGVLGAICWDKDYTKRLLIGAGLPTIPYVTIPTSSDRTPQASLDEVGLPAFVKPARGGSSLGISRIADWSELASAIEHARGYDHKVLLEPSIAGREISCAVLESCPGRLSVSGPIEALLGDHAWYDYEAKYFDPACELVQPVDLDPETITALQHCSLAAFNVLGCTGLARVDFFVRPDHSFLISEVNSMPGFTQLSMFPTAWANAGLDYASLLDRIIDCAISIGPR